MATRTDFEIRFEDDGPKVFVFTSWWTNEGAVRTAGGLACSAPFRSVPAAIAWAELQFEVPTSAWWERPDGTMAAGKGEPLPPPKTRPAKPQAVVAPPEPAETAA